MTVTRSSLVARVTPMHGRIQGDCVSTTHEDRTAVYRISFMDDDPLRARRDARELLTEISETDPGAALDIPSSRAPVGEADKGVGAADLIGLVFNGGSMVAAAMQVWLARVPQRTVVVSRPDGTTLTISGRQAREDDQLIERFLTNGAQGRPPLPSSGDTDTGATAD